MDEKIYEKTLKTFNGDDLATSVFLKKYAMSDADGNILETSLDDVKKRMLKAIMKVETKKEIEQDYKELLKRFLPGGRVLYGLGNEYDENSSFSNCYVLSNPQDSLESIFETAKKQARIYSRGGGCGLDVSNLRPSGSKVNNVAKTSTGAVSFMDLYSQITGLIAGHGRRGALLLTMDCKSPDLINFINVKAGNDKTKIQFANISIKITDDFMKAVESDDDWEMSFVSKHETITKKENARKIWDLIVESNWKGAEPGMLFWDTILSSPASCFEKSKPISCNPCAR